jgi:hypothetical protein
MTIYGNDVEEAVFDKMDMLDATAAQKDAERSEMRHDCPCEDWDDDELRALLTERGSIIPDSREEMVDILQNDEIQELNGELSALLKERRRIEELPSEKTDRSVVASLTRFEEREVKKRIPVIKEQIAEALHKDEGIDSCNSSVQPASASSKPLPICNDWKMVGPHLLVRSSDLLIPSIPIEKVKQIMDDGIDYTTKDNSKLRVILHDRELPDHGTREEMIELLQLHPAKYQENTDEELTEMLKGVTVRMLGRGTEQTRSND